VPPPAAVFREEAHQGVHGREIGGVDELAAHAALSQQTSRQQMLEMKRPGASAI
jgi:hypothetical protein